MKHLRRTIIKCGAILVLAGGLYLFSTCGSGERQAEEKAEKMPPRANRQKSANYQMPVSMDSLRPDLDRKMKRVFNDSNHYQLAHAEYMGIDPMESNDELSDRMGMLKQITDTRTYKLDKLTHSVPYLVPEAATLLNDIGQAFRDTLQCRGLPPMRMKVTSLLRTRNSVKSLRRVNRNATQNSTHQYGTTFDISYRGFFLDSNGTEVYDPRYRLALAEAIYDLRAANRCMVKYEVKSPCFHITVIQ